MGHRIPQSLGLFTPIEKGLRMGDFLSRTRSTSGSGGPLMRAFAGLKPLPIRFTSPSLPSPHVNSTLP
ncbi:hypothetical protein M405DRAFT_814997 [Rhizopogon salebrosus TDB-379]|nr:hypothetical protein M405DRAFT_814997 [Rhizopogon salebrosus TDB-379]